MDLELRQCQKNVALLHTLLIRSNVPLYEKVQYDQDNGLVFFVLLSPFAENNDLHCPNNIFIDVNDYSNEQNPYYGEVVVHYGFARLSLRYTSDDSYYHMYRELLVILDEIINEDVYTYYYRTPIGSYSTGIEYFVGNLDEKQSFVANRIQDYYNENIYKEGMEKTPDVEAISKIVEILEPRYKNYVIRTIKYSDKEPKEHKIFNK